ncbi:uncharacterized protein AKAME5_001019600 [Lates japonicus]|uniref:G-protein coupled receptors family 1 profile domain-containing protein n=2 Tax=Lates japonicus TaxID=270547 RepID=A0AAD3MPR6_LATJO|nr:uncharacterized protein AKAME5_001019600 [Lates japonicus]
MNLSSTNVTVVIEYRDSFTKAVTKNVIVVVLSISINYINAGLIHTFRKHQIFYMNPRYILFIHLVVNDMIQVTLTVMLFVISYTIYKLSVSVCGTLILIALFTTENTPLNLACMAVECYIAICVPLRHVQICTVRRTLMLIGLIWATSMVSVLPDLFITLATEPLDFFHSQVFCLRETAFRNPLIIKKRDITYIIYLVVVCLTFSFQEMNTSSTNVTVAVRYQDSFSKAVTKNVIVVVLGISISYINAGLIHTFCKHQIFYMNPRYILFIHLLVNDMIQVTLTIILFVISYTIYKVNVSVCCMFVLIVLFTTENTPLNLACMAVECYIAICVPLRHVQICTVRRTLMLIGLIWATSMVSVLPDLFITLATEPLDFFHSQVFCLRQTVFPNPLIIKKRDITYTIFKVNTRYILFIHLVVNDMIQLTISISLFIFTYTFNTIYVSVCCFLILPAILTTLNTPLNLAFMAAECYIAVCIPLRYNYICTVKRTYIVIGIIWATSSLSVLPDIFILLATEPLEFLNSRVYCYRDSVFRSTYSLKKRDASHIFFLVVVWLTLFYTYFRILFAAKAADADAKKARNTILLHGFQIFKMNPRFILFIHLVVNDMIQLTISISLFIFSYVFHTIYVSIDLQISIYYLRDLQDPQIVSMNSSSLNVSSALSYRDSWNTAVAKNVIVVALGFTINYINGTLIHTFRKHQIFYVNPRYILFIHLVFNDMIQLTTTLSLFVFSKDSTISDMNVSSVNGTFTVAGIQRDTFTTAVTKNLIVTALCISINYINGTLIHTFRKHQIFYSSPRYILFIHLVINDMMQLALSTLLHIISYALYIISVPFCLILLIITILTTLNTPLNLAGMAVECYIAICVPLRHGQICTIRKTYILIGLIWAASACSILPDLFILLATEPLQFFHSKVLCARDFVFRSNYSQKKREVSHIVCLALVWLTLFYTYFRILFAAKEATADFKKARNTILLHGFQLLLCMLIYVRPMFEQGLFYLLPEQHSTIRFTAYVIVQIMPRFVSPIVYGLRDQTFRRYVTRYLLCKLTFIRDTFTTAFVKNLIVVLVWLILSYINGTLVATFFRHQAFYEDPRYILFIHMVINDAIQLTVTITLFVLSYIFYKINVSFCCLFILVAVFTTRNTPVNLASMAIERYIAICEPLRHSQICTVRRTYMVIGLIWFICVAPDITDLFVTLATESLSFFHESVFCLRQNVFKDPILAQKRQAFDIIYFSCVFLTLIFTYLRIMFAARAVSTEKISAQRARNTILLHGVQLAMCLLSYISPSVELVLHLMFPGRMLEIRFANYLIVYILPRFLSPVIYGVRDKKFRKYFKMYLLSNRCRKKQQEVDPRDM